MPEKIFYYYTLSNAGLMTGRIFCHFSDFSKGSRKNFLRRFLHQLLRFFFNIKLFFDFFLFFGFFLFLRLITLLHQSLFPKLLVDYFQALFNLNHKAFVIIVEFVDSSFKISTLGKFSEINVLFGEPFIIN